MRIAFWVTAAAAVSFSAQSFAQQAGNKDPFSSISVLIGTWEGTSEGQPGKGTVRREYSRAVNGRFIRVRNRSEYPPREKNPKGEIHEEIFELAEGGKPFEVYSHTRLARKKP